MKGLQAIEFKKYPSYDKDKIFKLYSESLKKMNRKIIVLDDDPTGTQTVNNVYVYTNWDKETIRKGFLDENKMFFILTNSRSFSKDRTIQVHKSIGKVIQEVSKEVNIDYIIISRGDSTLRGHYPIETNTLKEAIESSSNRRFNGEVIIPFFKEGNRYTIDDIHYAKEGNRLIPVGETEFAKDKTFGYQSSDLKEYIEEKTGGVFKANDVISISLKELRNYDVDGIYKKLISTSRFQKIIINAIDYSDMKVFTAAVIKAINKGCEFIFRTSAALPKILGGVSDRPYLNREELVADNNNGGIVIIGSHVDKTTQQLYELIKSNQNIEFIEFNQHLVKIKGGLEKEVKDVIDRVESNIINGKNVVVYTKRERFDLDTDNKEKQLQVSVEISNAVTSIISKMSIKPNFIISKGGITSSDIATKALNIKKALVLGQVKPGIPVWQTEKESKFPEISYIIFPGNVGEEDTLKNIVSTLTKEV